MKHPPIPIPMNPCPNGAGAYQGNLICRKRHKTKSNAYIDQALYWNAPFLQLHESICQRKRPRIAYRPYQRLNPHFNTRFSIYTSKKINLSLRTHAYGYPGFKWGGGQFLEDP